MFTISKVLFTQSAIVKDIFFLFSSGKITVGKTHASREEDKLLPTNFCSVLIQKQLLIQKYLLKQN